MVTAEEKLQRIKMILDTCTILDDDFCPDVYSESGGNFDDAHDLGLQYGESSLAKRILEVIEDNE